MFLGHIGGTQRLLLHSEIAPGRLEDHIGCQELNLDPSQVNCM